MAADDLPASPILPDFYKTARAIYRNARAFGKRLTWLVPLKDGQPVLPNRFVLPEVRTELGADIFFTFCTTIRGTAQIWVILYIRVSDDDQATRGGSLEATFKMLLMKCAARGLMVAGIGIDIQSGKDSSRPAMDAIEAAVQAKVTNFVLTSSIERVDRDEENFVARMARWGRNFVVTYYGRDYLDARFDYVFWPDISSRERAVPFVRAAENSLNLQRNGKRSSLQNALSSGRLCVYNKDDTFVLVDLYTGGDKTKQHTYLRKNPRGRSRWNRMVEAFRAAAENSTWEPVDELARRLSKDTGKRVRRKDLVWEAQVGFAIGLNRPSPDSVEAAVPCKALQPPLEPDEDRFAQVMLDIAALCKTTRQRGAPIAEHDRVESESLRLAEIQETDQSDFRLTYCCHAHEVPVPLRVAGGHGRTKAGIPQQAVFCPVCTPRPSGKGRQLVPQVRDLIRAQAMPPMACVRCLRRTDLVAWKVETYGELEIPLFRCTSCHVAPAAYGAARPTLGRAWPVAGIPPAAANPRPPNLEPPRRKSRKERSAIPNAWIPRKPWTKPLPGPTTSYPEMALLPGAVADRMMTFVAKVGHTHYVTWTQLRVVAAGSTPAQVWNRRDLALRNILHLIRQLAKGLNLHLVDRPNRERSERYFWLEAKPKPRGLGSNRKDSHVSGRIRDVANGPLPPSCPYKLAPIRVLEKGQFFKELEPMDVATRLLATVLAHPKRAFSTRQFQTVGLGRSVPAGGHYSGAQFNRGLRRFAILLRDRGIKAYQEQFASSWERAWWFELPKSEG